MADTFIRLPSDGTGKKHRSWSNTVGADEVHATAGVMTATDGTVLADADGLWAQGNAASGATDSGNPVKVGGVYNSTLPSLADGERGDAQLTSLGELIVASTADSFVQLADSSGSYNGLIFDPMNVDDTAAGRYGLPTRAHLYGFDGTNWDRLRTDITNGLDVDVTRLPALPAGTNNIGDIDVASFPAAAVGGGTEAAALRVTLANNSTGLVSVDDNGGTLTVDDGGSSLTVDGTFWQATQPVSLASLPALVAGNANIGDVDVASLPSLPAGDNNIGNVDIASVPTAPAANVSAVSDTATSVQLLGVNTARLGAMIYNDSDQALFIKFGTTASTSSFTVKVLAGGYFEFPQPVYTGRVDGIWAADSSGNAFVTELLVS